MIKRKYLFVGSAGLLMLTPLALTSFNRAIKRLGPKRWQALHRLVYLAAAAGVLHFYMLVKSDERLPIGFAIAIGMLLLFRLVWPAQRKLNGAQTAAAGGWNGILKVDAIEDETPDVRTFRLVAARDKTFPFKHQPGQHLSLDLQIDGKAIRRSYTIASSPTKPGCCELSIKRETGGVGSCHMHDNVQVGDRLRVTAPAGSFIFTGGAVPAVALVGGGVGITPLMAIVRYLTDSAWPGQIHLLYSNKEESDIVFRRELADLSQRFSNVHVTHTLTRADGASWKGRTGRIDGRFIAGAVPNYTKTPFYICGPTAMIQAVKQDLQTLGVPQENIYSESFGGLAAGAATAETFTVTFAKSQRSGPAVPGKSILEVAEALGVAIDFECRSGICGRCACPLRSGTVVMAVQDALTANDRAAGKVLLCHSQATSDVLIDG